MFASVEPSAVLKQNIPKYKIEERQHPYRMCRSSMDSPTGSSSGPIGDKNMGKAKAFPIFLVRRKGLEPPTY